MLDAVAKRQVALATFVLIQAVKVVDWWSLHLSAGILGGPPTQLASASSLLLRWTVMEGSFVVLLWLAKVPRLTFTLAASLVLVAMLTGLNAAILLGVPLTLRSLRAAFAPAGMGTFGRETADGDADFVIDDIAGSKDQFIEGKGLFRRASIVLVYLAFAEFRDEK